MNLILRIFLILFVFSHFTYAQETGPANSVMRVPSGGGKARMGTINLGVAGTVGTSLLVIGNGGTGQATKGPAFDALSPMTASGDMTYGGASGTGTRLPKGTDGEVLGLVAGLPAWVPVAGTGTVTSVNASVPAASILGVTGGAITTTGTLAFTTTGTSGGIPYFSDANTLTTSSALTVNALVLGGGAGASPTVLGSLGTTVTVLHGNAGGAPTFGAVALASDVSGTLAIGNGGTGQTTATLSFNALSPMTTGGDLIYGGASGVGTRLANGSVNQVLRSAGGTSAPTWGNFDSSIEVSNLGIATSVGSSALTIALKQADGSTDPAASGSVSLGMRSSTITSGLYNRRSVTGALSLVISSGSTLGQVSGQASRIWIYLIDNAGTLELSASHKKFSEDALVSTTAEGGGGAADSASVMYSTVARTNVPCRLIGYLDNNQTTAGTWASAGATLQLLPTQIKKSPTVQRFTSGTSTYYTPAGCIAIKIKMVGGGGGGSGSGTASAGVGTSGASSTFGSSLLTASNGGGGGAGGGGAGGGGTNTINAPAVNLVSAIGGTGGGFFNTNSLTTLAYPGGMGGSTLLGVTPSSSVGSAGTAAATNSGAGGSGGGAGTGSANNITGTGGGGGGYIEALIADPDASYAYTVGAAGTAGAAGTSGAAGGAGAAGMISIEEFYE